MSLFFTTARSFHIQYEVVRVAVFMIAWWGIWCRMHTICQYRHCSVVAWTMREQHCWINSIVQHCCNNIVQQWWSKKVVGNIVATILFSNDEARRLLETLLQQCCSAMMKQQVCIDRTSMFSGTVNNSEVYNCWQCLFQLVNKLLQQWLNNVVTTFNNVVTTLLTTLFMLASTTLFMLASSTLFQHVYIKCAIIV